MAYVRETTNFNQLSLITETEFQRALVDLREAGLTPMAEQWMLEKGRQPYNDKVAADAAYRAESDRLYAEANAVYKASPTADNRRIMSRLAAARAGWEFNAKFIAFAPYLYDWPFPTYAVEKRTLNGIPLIFAFKLDGTSLDSMEAYIAYWMNSPEINFPDIKLPYEDIYSTKALREEMWGIFLREAFHYAYFLKAIKILILQSKIEFPAISGSPLTAVNQGVKALVSGARPYNGLGTGVTGAGGAAFNWYPIFDPYRFIKAWSVRSPASLPFGSQAAFNAGLDTAGYMHARSADDEDSGWEFNRCRGTNTFGRNNVDDLIISGGAWNPWTSKTYNGANGNWEDSPPYSYGATTWGIGVNPDPAILKDYAEGYNKAIYGAGSPWVGRMKNREVGSKAYSESIPDVIPYDMTESYRFWWGYGNGYYSNKPVRRWEDYINAYSELTRYGQIYCGTPPAFTKDDYFSNSAESIVNSLALLHRCVRNEIAIRFYVPTFIAPHRRGFWTWFMKVLPFVIPVLGLAASGLMTFLLRITAIVAGQQAAKLVGGFAGMIVGAIVSAGVTSFGTSLTMASPTTVSPSTLGGDTWQNTGVFDPSIDITAGFAPASTSLATSSAFSLPTGDYASFATLNYGGLAATTASGATSFSALTGTGITSGLSNIAAESSSLIGSAFTSFAPITASTLTSGLTAVGAGASSLASFDYLAPLTTTAPTYTSAAADWFTTLTAPTTGTVSSLNNYLPTISAAGSYASLGSLSTDLVASYDAAKLLATFQNPILPTAGQFTPLAALSSDLMTTAQAGALPTFTAYNPAPSLQQAFNPTFVTGLSTPTNVGTLSPSYKFTEEMRQYLPVPESMQQILGKGLDAVMQQYIGISPEMLNQLSMSPYMQAALTVVGATAPDVVKYAIGAVSAYDNREALTNLMEFETFLPAAKQVAMTTLPQFSQEIRVAYEIAKFAPYVMDSGDLLSRIPEMLSEGFEEIVKGIAAAPQLAVKGMTYVATHVDDLPPLIVKGVEYTAEKLPPLVIEGVQETVKAAVYVPELTVKGAAFVMDKAPDLVLEGLEETGKVLIQVPELAVKGMVYTAEKLPPLIMEGLEETGKAVIKAPEYVLEGLSETAKFLANLELPRMGAVELPALGIPSTFGLAPLSTTTETIAVVVPDKPTTFTQQPVPTSTAANGETIIHLPMQEIRVSLWPMAAIGAAAAFTLILAADD